MGEVCRMQLGVALN